MASASIGSFTPNARVVFSDAPETGWTGGVGDFAAQHVTLDRTQRDERPYRQPSG